MQGLRRYTRRLKQHAQELGISLAMCVVMRHQLLSILAISEALLHCGAYMDVDDAPRTALQAGATPQPTSNDLPPVVRVAGSSVWPLQTDVQPSVMNMPASAETSVDSVAKYLAAREPDPLMLVKALHDWVADRIAYAKPIAAPAGTLWWNQARYNGPTPAASFVLLQNPLDPPLPDRTFVTRKGVCGDYAALLTALGKHTGNPDIDIRYVTGYARNFGVGGADEGYHAWNVAHVKGQAYMVDATWDAGYGDGAAFQRNYKTDYLFTPPDVFAMTHYPDWPEDQHTTHSMTRAEFEAQPLLNPRFYELALSLDPPPKHANKRVEIVLENPFGVELAAEVVPSVRAPLAPIYATPVTCQVSEGRKSVADCALATPGQYSIVVFARTGSSLANQVAMIDVQSDG